MVESNYRRALVLSNGDPTTFIRNPISAGLLATAAIVLIGSLLRQARPRVDAR
jgi:putative tricarboxylic transport membrane protein